MGSVPNQETWTISKRKRLADSVSELEASGHEQILRIINSRGLEYSYNKNGVFCDITKAPVEVLQDISEFVEFSKSNEEKNPIRFTPNPLPPQNDNEENPGGPSVQTPEGEAAPVYTASKVKAFASSVIKAKTDSANQKRKEANRYNQVRKKFLRECTCKTTFAHELQPE